MAILLNRSTHRARIYTRTRLVEFDTLVIMNVMVLGPLGLWEDVDVKSSRAEVASSAETAKMAMQIRAEMRDKRDPYITLSLISHHSPYKVLDESNLP